MHFDVSELIYFGTMPTESVGAPQQRPFFSKQDFFFLDKIFSYSLKRLFGGGNQAGRKADCCENGKVGVEGVGRHGEGMELAPTCSVSVSSFPSSLESPEAFGKLNRESSTACCRRARPCTRC